MAGPRSCSSNACAVPCTLPETVPAHHPNKCRTGQYSSYRWIEAGTTRHLALSSTCRRACGCAAFSRTFAPQVVVSWMNRASLHTPRGEWVVSDNSAAITTWAIIDIATILLAIRAVLSNGFETKDGPTNEPITCQISCRTFLIARRQLICLSDAQFSWRLGAYIVIKDSTRSSTRCRACHTPCC